MVWGSINSVGQVVSFVVLCSFAICVGWFYVWLLLVGLVIFEFGC